MIATKIFLYVFTPLAATLSANAAVIDLFSDPYCQNHAGQRNVWDNTYAKTGGFESFRIVYPGGFGQRITAYLRNDCAGNLNVCQLASNVGACIGAWSGAGSSNALSSYDLACTRF